jgi:hypothetical protein
MNHWNLFKESWRIFWRNPALWVFGLLAALGGGTNLRYNFNFDFGNSNFDPELFRRFGTSGQRMPEMPFEFRALLNQIFSSQTFGIIVAVGIVWMIIAFLLVTYADGALMGMVNTIGGGQKVGVGFGFRAGVKRFLPLLGVRFTLALPALILGLISAIVMSRIVLTPPGDDLGSLATFTRSFSVVSGLGALAFVVSLLMMAIGVSAERAVVLDEQPIWPSIVKGWKFLWSKFGDYFTIVLLFILVGIAAGLVFACILIPILCGTLGLGAASAFSDNNLSVFTRLMVFTGPMILIAVLLGLLFGTLANVFTSSVWTLAYRQWTQPAQPVATALSPVASIDPIAPIEPLTPPNSSDQQPPQEGSL